MFKSIKVEVITSDILYFNQQPNRAPPHSPSPLLPLPIKKEEEEKVLLQENKNKKAKVYWVENAARKNMPIKVFRWLSRHESRVSSEKRIKACPIFSKSSNMDFPTGKWEKFSTKNEQSELSTSDFIYSLHEVKPGRKLFLCNFHATQAKTLYEEKFLVRFHHYNMQTRTISFHFYYVLFYYHPTQI